MSTPTTTLDPRFSDADTAPTSWDAVNLRHNPHVILTTGCGKGPFTHTRHRF